MKHITKALIANGYNQHMIKKVEKKLVRRSQENAPSFDQPLSTTILPYIPGTSEILRRTLNNHKIRCIVQSKNTLSSILSKPKDQINLQDQNNVAYEIPCKDCDAIYIGETKRQFKQRLQEHRRAVRNRDTNKNEIADTVGLTTTNFYGMTRKS